MAFIAGILDFEKSIEVETAITSLRQAVARTAEALHIIPNKFGIVCSGDRPEQLPRTSRWICIDGYVDSSLKDLDSQDADSLLSNTPLEGEFALSLFDEEAATLILRRDLLGLVPLYYSFTETKFVWGSDIKTVLALIGEKPIIDEQGLQELLVPEGPCDLFRTPFKNVFNLEPGFTLRISKDSVKKTKVEEFRITKSHRSRNFSEICEEFRFLLSKSISTKTKKKKTAVSLNGASDSFAIFSSARDLFEKGKLSHSPLAINYLPAGKDSPPSNYVDQLWTLESPFISQQWLRTAEVYSHARENSCEILLSGQWGDQLVNAKASLKNFFQPKKWRDLRQQVTSFWSLPGSLHQKNIYRLLKSKNHYLCNEWLYKIGRKFNVGTAQPFLDRDLVQFLFDIRGNYLIQNTNLLKESMKPISKVEFPLSNTEASQEFLSDSYVLEIWKRLFTDEFFDMLEQEDCDNVDLNFCKAPGRVEYQPGFDIREYVVAKTEVQQF